MSQGVFKTTEEWGRREWTAAILCVVMVAMLTRSLYGLYLEGDAICMALQTKLERLPGERMPCTQNSYLAEPIDWLTVIGRDGKIPQPVASTYRFDDDGNLLHYESDHGSDGQPDVTYDCTVVGKVLMPVTNYQAWSSYGAMIELAKQSAPAPGRSATHEGSTGVKGLRTTLRVKNDEPLWVQYEARTHADGDRLVRRVVRGDTTRALTDTSFDYAANGDLISSRSTRVAHPNTSVRQTDYTYRCWDER